MSRHSHTATKISRSNASREIESTLASKESTHSVAEASITNSMLHKTSHSSNDHHTMVAEGAYRRAEQRSFSPGYELDDWLAAETELDQRLAGEGHAY